MGTDRCACRSRLRWVDPVPKLWLSLAGLLVCVFADSAAVGGFTLLVFSVLNLLLGGHTLRILTRFFAVPMGFLAIGCGMIAFRPLEQAQALWAMGNSGWGISRQGLLLAWMVLCKALGALAAVYFFSMNTLVTDLTWALRRLRVPGLLVELMELIYRFLFLLREEAARIQVAQKSRLGYQSIPQSLRSAGMLAGMVLLRALRRGDRVYTALESRGYTGQIATLPGTYTTGRWCYPAAAAIAVSQGLILLAERGSWI